jgi:hypothetical protein
MVSIVGLSMERLALLIEAPQKKGSRISYADPAASTPF